MPESTRELASSRRRLAALLATTHAIAEAPSLIEAARKAMAALAEAEGASAGILWLASERGDQLRCAEVWSATPHPELERAARGASILRGEGLAGRAWASGRPVLASQDVPFASVASSSGSAHPALPPSLRAEGFRAFAAVPIAPGAGAGVAAVLEIFDRPASFAPPSRPSPPPDALVEEVWTAIGVALGQVARRVAVEQALACAEERTEDARRRTEAQLIEADRLASLGRLAAGVAHEINNPLSYVLLNLDVLLREAAADPERGAFIVPRLREARSGVERVRLIAQDLKSFSRIDTERRTAVDVRRILDSTIEIAANEIRHRACLTRAYGEVPAVLADPSRLGQVFLNLLVNAAQAIVDPAGPADRAANEIRVSTAVDAAGHVVVEISDTGAGIPPELLERIFDPFFTTKPAGVGTGLGLSIVRGIVTGLGGEIAIESRPGGGTTFRVTLPAAAGPALYDEPTPPPTTAPAVTRREGAVDAIVSSSPDPSLSPSQRPSVPTPRRRGRVLVIDDEPALAAALARSIERDHEVVVISSGREALERLRTDTAFDVILCDLIMPQVTGMDIHAELLRTSPALAERVVFMTGGTFTARARDFLASVGNPALDKPFDLSTLSALLRARTRR